MKQAPRKGVFEFVLRFVGISPLRCQLCTYRFMGVLWRVNHKPGREYERIPVQYPVYFRPTFTRDDVRPIQGTITALSIRGCTIDTRVPVPRGDCLCLQFEVSGQDLPIQIDAARVRTVNGMKMGVVFVSIKPEEEARLRQLLMLLLHNRLP